MGLIHPPIAEAAATDEPDNAPKSIFARILACARFYGIFPTNICAKLISLLAIPPLFIILPARMNNGTAKSEKAFNTRIHFLHGYECYLIP